MAILTITNSYFCLFLAGVVDRTGQQEFQKKLFDQHGVYPQNDNGVHVEHIVAPTASRHFDGYKQIYEGGEKSGVVTCAFCVGITQDNIRHTRTSPWVPSLCKTSSVLFRTARIAPGSRVVSGHTFSSGEIDFAYGWPSADAVECEKCKHCLVVDTSKTTLNSQAELAGNAIHIAAVSAWNLYVASHVLRRDELQRMGPPLAYVAPRAKVAAITIEENQNCYKEVIGILFRS